jgi:peptidoglycan hydrolase-like protein with peptidoglycan-binding domain
MNLRDIALGTVVYPLNTVRTDVSTTRDIQFRLLSWGYQPGPADGDWGKRTEDAYIKFAGDYRYSTTVITPRTAAHLTSLAFRDLKAIANQPSTFPLFSLRDNPHLARDIQERLTAMGYSPGAIDGLWGPSTQAAFTTFAQTNQYPSDRLSPKAAKTLLGQSPLPAPPAPPPHTEVLPPPVAPLPPPPPAAPPPPPLPVTAANSLRDIALGTTTYPLSVIRKHITITRDIQSRLVSWGYQPGPIDGDWRTLTESAFIAFARDYGYLNQSITPQSAAHLASPAFRNLQAIANQASTFTLFSIKSNPLIAKAVQQRLQVLSYYNGPLNGDWNNDTQTAYEKFAQAYQLPLDRMPPQAAQKLLDLPGNDTSNGAVPTGPVPNHLSELRQQADAVCWPLTQLATSSAFIRELQQALTAMGHAPGTIDGLWGSRTQVAYESMAQVYGARMNCISPRVAKLLLAPEIPNIRSLNAPPAINRSDYIDVARMIGTDAATIRAVVEVEAAGSGFFGDGRPKILFEAHWFSAFTNGRYDYQYPNISSPVWNRSLYIGGVGEWDRLYQALRLDRAGALKSASWGLGQIMGFNHRAAGYTDVEAFVKDMHQSEGKHLTAMFNFISYNGLTPYLVKRDWAGFALRYNGEGYRINQYDIKLAQAYEYWRNVA